MSMTMSINDNLKRDARFWDRAARKYAGSKIGDMEGYERTLARTAAFLNPQAKVLELGCGTGTTALRLAPLSGSYLATDLSPEMIAIADEKLAAQDSRAVGLSFAAATAETVTPPEGGFDVVLGFNYLHLVEDPAATLRSVSRLLRPGGLVITKTVCLKEMTPLIPLAISLMRAFGKAPANVARMNEAEVLAAHEKAGFTILHNERHGSGKRDIRPFVVAEKV